MIRLLTAVLLFASFHAVAEVTLTDINNNEVADADEVMGNFNALKQGVEANATALQGLIEPNQLCGTGFSCLSGTYDYRYGSDAEAEWWGRPNANPNCGFGATGAFLYLLDSKWVLGTGLGGSSGVIATCNAATFVNHPTQCGSNWEDANGPIEASFSSGSCGDQKLSDLNCGADEIIKREGSAWVCASRSIVENLCGGDAGLCVALCAEGTTVVSGGCVAKNWNGLGYMIELQSFPKSDASGWQCRAAFSGSTSYVNAYAICQ